MNAQSHTQEVDVSKLSVAELADASTVEAQVETLESLSNQKLNEYYARRDELRKTIIEMTKAGNQREVDASKSELGNVEVEISKWEQNIGQIMSKIGHEMGMLEHLKEKLLEDEPEDIAKREATHAALARAEGAVVDAKAALATAETSVPSLTAELKKAEGTFAFFGIVDLLDRDGKVALAQNALDAANSIVGSSSAKIVGLETELSNARLAIDFIEQEIEVDKDHRVQQLGLDKLYAKLTDAEARVSKIVKENILATETTRSDSEQQLEFNRELRVTSAVDLQSLEMDITSLKEDFSLVKVQIEDLVGQETTPDYQRLENEVARLATAIDTKTAEKRLVEGKISTASVNVIDLEKSMAAMNSDILLAKSNYNEFVLVADKARVTAASIMQQLKNQAAKVAAQSISRGRDAMTLASVDMSIATDVANKGAMADDVERRGNLLDEINRRGDAGDAAGAAHDARYAEGAENLKEKYGEFVKGREGREGDDSPDAADKASEGDVVTKAKLF